MGQLWLHLRISQRIQVRHRSDKLFRKFRCASSWSNGLARADSFYLLGSKIADTRSPRS